MLINAKHAYGTALEGSDGRVGTLYDILFDDQSWRIRHLVVSTDRWFRGRQVLLEPEVAEAVDWPDRRLQVRLTRQDVRESPSVDTDLPAARQQMLQAAQVLLWEAYWTGVLDSSTELKGDPHLRSTKMLTGLHIHCTDGPLGHVADFVIDDETWTVCDLVVDTRNWWPGKHVLVEPTLVESIHWEEREIRLALPREQLDHRPAYPHEMPSHEPMVGSV
jgi:sporulation protein YlmC with PRC-barrel domain